MAELIMELPKYEPMKTNRWVVKMGGGNIVDEIPKYLFRNFKLYSEKIPDTKNIGTKLDLDIHSVIGFLVTPDMFVSEKNIVIDFLDPTGTSIEKYDMDVSFDNFELIGDYSDNSILSTKVTYWVRDIRTIQTDEIDKKAVENYLKNKEKVESND